MVKKMLILIVISALFSGCTRKLFISDHGSKKIISCDLKKNSSGNFVECINSVVVTDVVDAFSASYFYTDSDEREIYVYDDKKIKVISFDDYEETEIINESLEEMSDLYYDEKNKLFFGVTKNDPRLVKITRSGDISIFDQKEESERPYEKPTTVSFKDKTFVYWLDKPNADTSKMFLIRKDFSQEVDDQAELVLSKEEIKPPYNFGEVTQFLIDRENGVDYMYWGLNTDDTINDKIVKTNLETFESVDWVRNRSADDETIRYPTGITIGNNGKTIFFVTNGSNIVGGSKKLSEDSPIKYSILKVDHNFEHPTIVRYAKY